MGGWISSAAFLHIDSLNLDTILLVFAITLILVKFWQCDLSDRQAHRRQPPGPWGLPILGHLPFLGKNSPETLHAMSEKYGSVFAIRMGSRPTVMVSGYDVILNVIVRQSIDFAGRPDFMSWKLIGDGETLTFTSYSPAWSIHKKLALKAVHMYLNEPENSFQSQVTTEAGILVSRLLEKGQEGLDPANIVEFSAASVIYSVCFGGTGELRLDEAYLKRLGQFHLFQKLAGNPGNFMRWMVPFLVQTPAIKRYSESQRLNVSLVLERYRKHQETFDSQQIRDVTDALIRVFSDCEEGSLKNAQLPIERVICTTIALMGAGIVTVKTTLAWAILYVTKFPDVQRRIQEELDDVIGHMGFPERWDPSDFPYTMATLLETLRFANISPFLMPHAAIRDTTLNGYRIAKHTMVFCNMYSVSKDANLWRDPHNFNPANFLDPTEKMIDPSKRVQLLAFGAGRRRCPGERIAKLEMLILFSALLHNCVLEPVANATLDLDPDYAFSLNPKPYYVKIRPRKV